MSQIYLDYASLTPIDSGVMKQIKKYSTGKYTNPSSIYTSGVNSKKAIEDAKVRIAKILHCHSDEIIFTSGGTESNNLVLKNFSESKIMISIIEHSSILRNSGIKNNIVYIPVDKNGLLDLDFLKEKITHDTTLVSVMMVNNEIGNIEPINEISKIVRDTNKKFGTNIIFHTDACQAATHLPLYVEKLGIDMMTLDGHKIYGPRGIGILYVKRGSVGEKKIVHSGTENTPAIMGLAYAIELADKMRVRENKRISELKDFFVKELRSINKEIKINGGGIPHILNISIPNIDSEFFILQLDSKGIECSTKSACLIDEDESYVLKAISADSKNSIRFSFGRKTSKSEIKETLKIMKNILAK